MITNTLKIIDLKNYTVEVQEFLESKVPLRAFHSQCIYGKFLIVSGGTNKNSKLFNNFMNYNYEKKYWNQLAIQAMPEKLKVGFSKHQTVPVFHPRKNYSIYDYEPIIQKDENIKEQGIYLFGGEDTNAELMSNLYIVKLGAPSIVIYEPKIDGKSPLARRNTCMIRHKQYLIIHGGRNDELKPFVLNSLHFLNLKTMNWIEVAGEKPPYRYSHSLSIVEDDIIIMGGKGIQGICKEVYRMSYEEIIE